jgi:type IV pilus assembly protein PilW
MYMMKSRKKNKGFTLIELMVAMAIASIALASIYGSFHAQVKANTTQEVVVDLQQNLRTAMYFLQRSVRMAGYGAGAGFVDNFTGLEEPFASSGATRNSTAIAFTADFDDDGEIDGSIAGNTDAVNDELIAYRFNAAANTLQKYFPSTDTWDDIAEKIESVNFDYLDEDFISTAVAAEIRSVAISITAQPVQDLTIQAADKMAPTLTAQVQCRNIGLP